MKLMLTRSAHFWRAVGWFCLSLSGSTLVAQQIHPLLRETIISELSMAVKLKILACVWLFLQLKLSMFLKNFWGQKGHSWLSQLSTFVGTHFSPTHCWQTSTFVLYFLLLCWRCQNPCQWCSWASLHISPVDLQPSINKKFFKSVKFTWNCVKFIIKFCEDVILSHTHLASTVHCEQVQTNPSRPLTYSSSLGICLPRTAHMLGATGTHYHSTPCSPC